ncbi:MAG: methyltransferase family protein [Phycisphaerae bacterium]
MNQPRCPIPPEGGPRDHFFGQGPAVFGVILIYWFLGGVGIVLAPQWTTIQVLPYWLVGSLGVLMSMAGVGLYVASLRALLACRQEGVLCTGGPFGLCRHPIYVAWGLLMAPGVLLIANSWLGAFGPILLHLPVRALAMREEPGLQRSFGEQYTAYRRRVPPVPGGSADAEDDRQSE